MGDKPKTINLRAQHTLEVGEEAHFNNNTGTDMDITYEFRGLDGADGVPDPGPFVPPLKNIPQTKTGTKTKPHTVGSTTGTWVMIGQSKGSLPISLNLVISDTSHHKDTTSSSSTIKLRRKICLHVDSDVKSKQMVIFKNNTGEDLKGVLWYNLELDNPDHNPGPTDEECLGPFKKNKSKERDVICPGRWLMVCEPECPKGLQQATSDELEVTGGIRMQNRQLGLLRALWRFICGLFNKTKP